MEGAKGRGVVRAGGEVAERRTVEARRAGAESRARGHAVVPAPEMGESADPSLRAPSMSDSEWGYRGSEVKGRAVNVS